MKAEAGLEPVSGSNREPTMKRFAQFALALATLAFAQTSTQGPARADPIILQSAQSGLYVTSVKGTLAAWTRDRSRALRLDTVRLDGNRMAFRDMRTGKYLRAGVGSGTLLAVASPHIRDWETFEVYSMVAGRVALRSAQNGKYVRAGVGRTSHLAAVSAGRPAGWETFKFVSAPPAQGNAGAGNGGGLTTRALAGSYRVTHVAAENGFLVRLGPELARASRLTLDRAGNVSASFGCNSLSIQIAVENGRVTARGHGMMTMMRCRVQGQHTAESGLLRALQTSRVASRNGREIAFRSAGGVDVLKLQRR